MFDTKETIKELYDSDFTFKFGEFSWDIEGTANGKSIVDDITVAVFRVDTQQRYTQVHLEFLKNEKTPAEMNGRLRVTPPETLSFDGYLVHFKEYEEYLAWKNRKVE